MKTSDGLWRLSPSGLYGFTECPSCFWIANHYMRVPMLPLLFNSAMDSILKARFDKYRADGEFPPEAKELTVTLLNGKYPGHNPECKNCAYYDGREKLFSLKKK